MEDKKILLRWYPFEKEISTTGHQMPDGWWYVYLPFDNDWHYVPDSDVTVIQDLMEVIQGGIGSDIA